MKNQDYQDLGTIENHEDYNSNNISYYEESQIQDDQENILPTNFTHPIDQHYQEYQQPQLYHPIRLSEDEAYYTSQLALLRYYLYRYVSYPLLPIFRMVPFFGTKTWFELLLLLFFYTLVMSLGGKKGSLTAGKIADVLGCFMIFLILRKNYFLRILGGFSFDQGIFWHKVAGYAMLVLMLIHSLGQGPSGTGITLAIFLGLAAVSYTFAFFPGYWNYFYLSHIGFYCLSFILAAVHGANFFAFSMLIWTIDLGLRYFVQRIIAPCEIVSIGSRFLKISFPKCFDYHSGQFVCIKFLELSVWEHHPIFIASSSSDENISMYIKCTGDWTQELHGLTRTDQMNGTSVYLEGPYGILSVNCFDASVYNVIILISGGIGVTPHLGLLKSLVNQRKERSNLDKIFFVWSVRELDLADYIYNHELHPIVSEFRRTLAKLEAANSDDNCSSSLHTSSDGYYKDLVDLRLHLTRFKDRKEINANKGELSHADIWRPSRPDLLTLFYSAEDYCKKQGFQRIAVMISGPDALLEETRILCDSFSARWKEDLSSIRFDCHEDSFGF